MKLGNSKPVIAYLDDSMVSLKILFQELKDEFLVLCYSKSDRFLKEIAIKKPDIILLDLILKNVDGYELCKTIKNHPELSQIPVIFVTSRDNQNDEERGIRVGAIDYFTKPFRIPIIRARLQNHYELKHYRDLLEEEGFHDSATGLPNRKQFHNQMQINWMHGLRYKTPIALMMMDIDQFKLYNDTYGHLAGDKCLRIVAQAIQKSVGEKGIVARYGGEEFVCALTKDNAKKADKIAQDILGAITKLAVTHKSSSVSKIVTISIGIKTVIPKAEYKISTLLEEADRQLYKAKAAGRNQVMYEQY